MAPSRAMLVLTTVLVALHGIAEAQTTGIACFVTQNIPNLGASSAAPVVLQQSSDTSTGAAFTSCLQTYEHFRVPNSQNVSGLFLDYSGWIFEGSSEPSLFQCASVVIAEQQAAATKWQAAKLGTNVFAKFQQTTCCGTPLCNNPETVPFASSHTRVLPNYAMLLGALLALVLLRTTLWA